MNTRPKTSISATPAAADFEALATFKWSGAKYTTLDSVIGKDKEQLETGFACCRVYHHNRIAIGHFLIGLEESGMFDGETWKEVYKRAGFNDRQGQRLKENTRLFDAGGDILSALNASQRKRLSTAGMSEVKAGLIAKAEAEERRVTSDEAAAAIKKYDNPNKAAPPPSPPMQTATPAGSVAAGTPSATVTGQPDPASGDRDSNDGPASEEPASEDKDNYWVPPKYLPAIRKTLGPRILDPATSEAAQEQNKFEVAYTKEQDGLAHDWKDPVFENPPYSNMGPWIDKTLFHLKNGDVPEAILLVSTGTKSAWWQKIGKKLTAVCFVAKAMVMYNPTKDNQIASSITSHCFVYFGHDPEKFKANFLEFGFVLGQGNFEAVTKTEAPAEPIEVDRKEFAARLKAAGGDLRKVEAPAITTPEPAPEAPAPVTKTKRNGASAAGSKPAK